MFSQYLLEIVISDEKSQLTTPRSWASSTVANTFIEFVEFVTAESTISWTEKKFNTPNVQVVNNQFESGVKHTHCTAPSCC